MLCFYQSLLLFILFFFNTPPPPQIYTLSLHDALPISRSSPGYSHPLFSTRHSSPGSSPCGIDVRSEEHTSELQSRGHLVCRLLLEKKKATPYAMAAHRHIVCKPPLINRFAIVPSRTWL